VERRVFISATSDPALDDRRRRLKAAFIQKIRDAGYTPQEFWEMGIAGDLPWTFDNVDQVMRQCVGAVIIGFPRWVMSGEDYTIRLVGEYHHYDGAVALTLGLPLLIIAEEGVEGRGIVWPGGGRAVARLPEDATETWLASSEFTTRFTSWHQALAARRDVFLGYCGKSAGTAAQIQLLLQKHGASVRNWAMDFRAGGSILDELERARATCSCGIFLFSEDDPLEGTGGCAAPRDNVVFEAGHFISSKGASRVLIIREGSAKMPADLGGSIYVPLSKAAGVAAIEGKLVQFLEENL